MSKEVKKTKKKKSEDLDITTRIRTDDSRLNEAESLDVSFIDGSKKKNISKEQKKALKEKKDYSFIFNIFKVIIYILVIGCLLVGGYYFAKKSNLFEFKKTKTKVVEKEKCDKVLMDDNYLFIGDSYTDGMDFVEFYKPYVKISNVDYTTSDILDDLRDYVYVYNPSVVFIQLGINDFKGEASINDVVNNIDSIIKGIKNNRSNAIIYVESLYPINDSIDGFNNPIGESIDNSFIKEVNEEIVRICKNYKVKYIDMYNELSENDLLKENYTDDGFNLNDEGYKKVFKVINRVVD